MNKLISLILVLVGVALIVSGVAASDSIGSAFSRLFTGEPTEKTIWLSIGGIVAVALGAGGLLRGTRSS